MILDLVKYNHPLLSTPAPVIDFNGDVDFEAFDRNMLETLNAHGAYGLSANQVGLPWRAFAMASPSGGAVLYNPRIVDASEASQELEEACLTFPGLVLKVTRPRIIKVRYSLRDGTVITKKFQDFTARVFQHELDHLNGVTIIDKMEGLKKQFARKKWDKLGRRNGYGPAIPTPRAVDTAYSPSYDNVILRALQNEMHASDEESPSPAM
jgi:peptide deformylase